MEKSGNQSKLRDTENSQEDENNTQEDQCDLKTVLIEMELNILVQGQVLKNC